MTMDMDAFRPLFFQALEAVGKSRDAVSGDDATFAAAGLDSLDRMNLLLALEDLMGRDLGAIDLAKVDTLRALHARICSGEGA